MISNYVRILGRWGQLNLNIMILSTDTDPAACCTMERWPPIPDYDIHQLPVSFTEDLPTYWTKRAASDQIE